MVSQYRFDCTYSGLSIQVLLYIQRSLITGSSVHTVVSQYRFYCTYSGLSIQVLLYIHTVVSQYRLYCTYSGLSLQVLVYIQWSLSTGSMYCSSTLFGAIIRDVLKFLFCFRQRRCHRMWCGATHDGDCGSRGCLAHGDNCAQNKTGLLKVSAVFVHVYTQVQLNTHLSTHIHIYTHRYI